MVTIILSNSVKTPQLILIRFEFSFLEIHILWAQHQVHHSSEEFNVTVGVRQSVFQSLIGAVSIN